MASLYRALALVALICMASTMADTDNDKKYCSYLDCSGKVKLGLQGEKFAAKGFSFGYCYCMDASGKKIPRYMACNFGDEFILDNQACVKNGKPK